MQLAAPRPSPAPVRHAGAIRQQEPAPVCDQAARADIACSSIGAISNCFYLTRQSQVQRFDRGLTMAEIGAFETLPLLRENAC